MSEEEKEAIEYLKTRLYGNEDCKYIDVAQEDLRIFVNLIDKIENNINSWKKYSDEQEENIIEKNNNICNLEFLIEKLQKENEELKQKYTTFIKMSCEIVEQTIPVQKIKNKIEEIDERIKYEENEKVVIYLHKQRKVLKELLESEDK